jgi:hypothetical protein
MVSRSAAEERGAAVLAAVTKKSLRNEETVRGDPIRLVTSCAEPSLSEVAFWMEFESGNHIWEYTARIYTKFVLV